MAAKKKTAKKAPKKTGKPKKAKKVAAKVKAKVVKRPPAKKAKSAKPAAPKRAAAPAPNPIRELARRILALSTASDDQAILDLYAPDVVSIEMNMPATVGVDALKQKFAGWRTMVTSATFVPKNFWVDGNTIVVEWTGDCVLAGSGKQVQLHEIAVHEIENGKIKRERYYYDPAALQP